MSSLVLWSWVFLVASIVLFVAMGYVGMGRTKNADDFAVARSSYGPWALGLAVVATTASGSTFLGIPGLAYSVGFSSLWYPIVYPLGIYMGMLLTAKLVKSVGDKFGNRSIPEFVGQRYDSDFLRVGLAIVSLLLMFYITAQLVAAATLFQTTLGVGYITGLIFTGVVLLIYITMGGSHADILTDAIQGLFMLALAVGVAVMFFVGFGLEGGAGAVNDAVAAKQQTEGWNTLFSPKDPVTASAWLVFLLFVAHLPFGVLPHIGNKFMALTNANQMRKFLMFVIVAGGIMPMMGLGGLLGAAVLTEEITPDAVIPTLFSELFPPIVAAFLAVAILSAILSTSDGLVVSISQILANDLYRKTFAGSTTPTEVIERNALLIGRVGVFLTLVGAVAMAWNPPEFLAILLWIGIGGIVSGMAGPIMIGSLWRRANKTGAITSFIVGVVGYALIYLESTDLLGVAGNPFAAAGYSVLIASAVMVIVTLLTRPMPEEFVNSIFGERRGPRGAQSPAYSRASANDPEGSRGTSS
jgi:SSS family transporter